ncbi:hypothetical protein O181_111202 [Austropuccinia psidii MF-1]|uniref:Uncharacterized protein n=1 Tax=Austropuccinia psidii MF-1 TaxID=1389203 RepID=A0A9Q3K1C1_9BASI|nr:hypothetical protein [Austropuccinia psidii MF-1]
MQWNRVTGITLDVFPTESSRNTLYFDAHLNQWTERLLKLPNTILTPHICGLTEEAQQVIGDEVATAIIRLELGRVRLGHVHHSKRGVLKLINSIVEDFNVKNNFLIVKVILHICLFVQETFLRRIGTFDQWLKVWKQIAKVLKRWSEPLQDLNSQRGANSQKAMILKNSFTFIHSSAKCHRNLVQVKDNHFLTFYGQIRYNIEPFGFRTDVIIDKGNVPIDLEEIQNNISSNCRAQLSIWMVLASPCSLPIPWIFALLCHSSVIFIEFSRLITDWIAHQNLDQNSLKERSAYIKR